MNIFSFLFMFNTIITLKIYHHEACERLYCIHYMIHIKYFVDILTFRQFQTDGETSAVAADCDMSGSRL
eukprot:m.114573 g.114573  ORF g.114573 m.114573 type:complete len:69 (-) comp28361_c0_seq1:214-420(-)